MKSIKQGALIIIGVALLITVWLAQTLTVDTVRSNAVHAVQAELDYGEITIGDIVNVSWDLRVADSCEWVVFGDIGSSCGCTEAQLMLDGQVLTPGIRVDSSNSIVLTGSYDSKKRGPGHDGFSINVSWVDSEDRTGGITLQGKCRLVEWCRLRPPVVMFGTIKNSTPAIAQVSLRTENGFQLKSWRATTPTLTLCRRGEAIQPLAQIEAEADIELRLEDPGSPGRRLGQIIITTAEGREVTIGATWRVAFHLELTPSSVISLKSNEAGVSGFTSVKCSRGGIPRYLRIAEGLHSPFSASVSTSTDCIDIALSLTDVAAYDRRDNEIVLEFECCDEVVPVIARLLPILPTK